MIEKKIVPNFPGRNLSDIFYNLKINLSNLKRFFWSVWTYRKFDYTYSLEILKVSLEGHLNAIINDSWEVEKDRLPKVDRLKRALELLDNKIEDDYIDRCGYNHDYKIDFKVSDITNDNGEELFEMVSDETPKQKKINSEAIKMAEQLEKDEWREFIEILHDDLQTWWT